MQFYFFSRAFSALFYYESHKSDAIKLLAEVSFRPTAHSMFPHPTENRLAFGLVTGQFVSLKYDPADPKTGLTDRKTIGDIE